MSTLAIGEETSPNSVPPVRQQEYLLLGSRRLLADRPSEDGRFMVYGALAEQPRGSRGWPYAWLEQALHVPSITIATELFVHTLQEHLRANAHDEPVSSPPVNARFGIARLFFLIRLPLLASY